MEQETPKWLKINEDGTKSVTEGSAEILFDEQVFYNPIQEFNRDMSTAAIKIWSQMYCKEKNKQLEFVEFEATKFEPTTLKQELKKQQQLEALQKLSIEKGLKEVNMSQSSLDFDFTILEALSATGLRSIRYAKEIPRVSKILSNDLSEKAVESIEKNAVYNKVDHIIQPNKGDACQVLYQVLGSGKKYDVIDLDPYGSASPFLDGAVQAVADGGLLCVTCTDLAVLAGSQPEACWAKYGGINIPNAPFTHEMAIRILLHTIQSSASRYKRAIEPLMSCHIDYYVRVFVRVRSSATLMKQASAKTSMVYYCSTCKTFETQPIGKCIPTEKGSKYGPATLNIPSQCQVCDKKVQVGGPFYSHPIHNPDFVDSMMAHVAFNHKLYGTWERMAGMSVVISEELLDQPLYYVLPKLCNVLHCASPPLNTFINGLLSTGYQVSQSHACVQAIKTNAPPQVVWDVMRHWCKKNPLKSSQSDTSPSHIILSREPETNVDFEKNEYRPISSKFQLVRFQQNPTANWGPQARPGKEKSKQKRQPSPTSKESKKLKSDQ